MDARFTIDKVYAPNATHVAANFVGYAVVDKRLGRIEGVYRTATEAYATMREP